jgi:hypothetical protein
MSRLLGSNLPEERFPSHVLVLNGVPYLPHYRNQDVYVGPGYGRANFNRYTAQELLLKGAQYQPEMLWSRGTNGIVNERNP